MTAAGHLVVVHVQKIQLLNNSGRREVVIASDEVLDKLGHLVFSAKGLHMNRNRLTWSVVEPEMAEFVSVSREGAVTVKKNCPEGKVTIAAAAEGAMPDQEVRAEIELEIVGTETK